MADKSCEEQALGDCSLHSEVAGDWTEPAEALLHQGTASCVCPEGEGKLFRPPLLN